MVIGLVALLVDPTQDELAADEVVPNLFWRVLFGVEEGRQRLVTVVPCALCAGNFDPVPDPASNRRRRDIRPQIQIDCDLEVSQFHCGSYVVDGDVGGN